MKRGVLILLSAFFTVLSIFCLFYYTLTFYLNGQLVLDKKHFGMWLAMVIIVITLLLIGFITLFNSECIKSQNEHIKMQNEKLNKQNEELKEIVLSLTDKTDDFESNIVEMLLNSREIELDKNKGE